MTERISNGLYESTHGHEQLYEDWANSGAGLLITGNVMVDRVHMESAGNVSFDDESMIPKLSKWADAGKKKGNHIWVQISHAGRQTNRFNSLNPLAPSAVQLKKIGLFGNPKAMTEPQVKTVLAGFIKAAKIAKYAGFTGVQIHAAHGYLLNQFLSPITNKRNDKWGGSLENRSRLLREIVKSIRSVVGPNFPISVKLNSSDFQRGGFTEDESLEVIKMLDEDGIDLLEISGGTYEKLVFLLLNDENAKQSTLEREAYFIDFSKKVRAISKLPLLITGGFRSFDFCNSVLKNGELDFIGMARPFITNKDEIKDFMDGKIPILDNLVLRTGIKQFDDAAEAGFYAIQLIRFSKGKALKPKISPLWCSNFLILHELKKAFLKKI